MLSQVPDLLLLFMLPVAGGLAGGLVAYLLGRQRANPALRDERPRAAAPAAAADHVATARRTLDALAAKWAAQEPAAPALPRAADLLLVDDSAVARAKLRRLFERAGYEVHLACDGVEALALLDKGRYAMMITDLEMPNMDGVTLINTCLDRPLTARMPIVAVSGHDGLRARFNECRDIAGVHRKPWVDDILLSHVATLVSASRERAVQTA